ncbi:hypothetical protein HZF08_23275 [Paenibacillus sp. CGMCC 1.16610]|uniref:Uncharacterized protein n=1 Tax=Paenibacillus anseongense TaxID=2682845 RepID=A0ABW9ULB9_9BACL|nr:MULTISPECIES: hypothetical protein [Paenibacillus]MBA2941205.1 hypothetical protein [Paenibacillus sp. CGMCC 1.16610]MVQ40025.1 hypothetical protein [Paenibacillus anseongense]
MTLALTGWMLYAMFVVLGLMGLSFLYSLYNALKAGSFSSDLFLSYLKDLLFYVFPLFMLSNMKALDPTGFLLLIGYYLGALGVALKYLGSFKK